MDRVDCALRELDRLQGIIERHEKHIYVLRGWLLVIIGGLLTSYYTGNVLMSKTTLLASLFVAVLLFLVVEIQHVNLVDAVVERAGEVEQAIQKILANPDRSDCYTGPGVNDACEKGAKRFFPIKKMTLVLNLPFYTAVIVIMLIISYYLPTKAVSNSADGAAKISCLNARSTEKI